jgi:hypothetical protein
MLDNIVDVVFVVCIVIGSACLVMLFIIMLYSLITGQVCTFLP